MCITTEDYVERARKVHGDMYDYSKTVFVSWNTKVCIICPEHGEFLQSPDSHLRDRGCPECGKKKRAESRRIWTKEKILKVAKKYKHSIDFKKANRSAYVAAQRMGLLEDLNNYWVLKQKPRNYWNYDNCKSAASECINRSSFLKKYPTAYKNSNKNGWLYNFFPVNEKNLKERIHSVYVYEDDVNKIVYVGRTLTRRLKIRDREHRRCGDTVYDGFVNMHIQIPEIVAVRNNLNGLESLYFEDYYVQEYRNRGYTVLNKAKTGVNHGRLGSISSGKLTCSYCYEVAKTCRTIKEFAEKDCSAYLKSCKMGWNDEYDWFEELHKPKGYWDNFDNFYNEYVRCGKSLTRLQDESSSCYKIALKNGFTKNLHTKRIAPNKKWTEQTLTELIKSNNYKTKKDLKEHEHGAYMACWRLGLLDNFFEKYDVKPRGYWNIFENIVQEAQCYKNRTELWKCNPSAYGYARKNGWLDILYPKIN